MAFRGWDIKRIKGWGHSLVDEFVVYVCVCGGKGKEESWTRWRP